MIEVVVASFCVWLYIIARSEPDTTWRGAVISSAHVALCIGAGYLLAEAARAVLRLMGWWPS